MKLKSLISPTGVVSLCLANVFELIFSDDVALYCIDISRAVLQSRYATTNTYLLGNY